MLPNLSIRTVPKTKKAIAGIYTQAECNSDIRFVFPKEFVEKCRGAIPTFCKRVEGCAEDSVGVKVLRFGIFRHRDISAMDRWHTSMDTKRISIPDHLADGVQSDPTEREKSIKMILLKGGQETLFGRVPYRSLLTLSENKWMYDNCMAHGLALLQREHTNVGIVNPIFSRFDKRETQLSAINAGNSFQETNKIVLLPLHVDNNHWCGAVFDDRRESRGIMLFDPLQAARSKYYDKCEDLLKNLFGEICTLMQIKRVADSRQPDVACCGAVVLMFFECYLAGNKMPPKPSQTQLRFFRLRSMLKCLQ
eukprot:jgi/Phyca11/106288/e_gw1.12.317.1